MISRKVIENQLEELNKDEIELQKRKKELQAQLKEMETTKKNNSIKFKVGFFDSLLRAKLKPSEYECLMLFLEDRELTVTQVKECLNISSEVSCRALKRLNKIGVIFVSKVVGRNKYYKVNPQFNLDEDYNLNQMTLID